MVMSRPESLGFPFLCSFCNNSLCFASFPCRAVLLQGRKSGMGVAERISRMQLLGTVQHLTTHGHPPQWGQKIPVDGQVHATAIASIPSLKPGSCDCSLTFNFQRTIEDYLVLNSVLLMGLLSQCPTQPQPETQLGTMSLQLEFVLSLSHCLRQHNFSKFISILSTQTDLREIFMHLHEKAKVPFPCSHYAALPLSVPCPVSELSCK